MDAFWRFARQMFKYRLQMALTICTAILAATTFGLAFAVALPLLKVILQKKETLPEHLARIDAGKVHGLIPDSLIAAAPTDLVTAAALLTGVVAGLFIFSAVCRLVQNYTAYTVCIMTVADIRQAVFARLVHLPLLNLLGEPMAERASKILRDSNQLQKGFAALMSKTMSELLKGVATLVVAIVLDPAMTVVAAVLAPILGLYYRMHGRRMKRLAKVVLGEAARMLDSVVESLQAQRVVKVHTAERVEVNRFRKVNQRYIDAEFPLRWRKSVSGPVIEIITTVGFAVMAVFTAWRIAQGRIDGESSILAVGALAVSASTLRRFTQIFNELVESAAAAERLQETLDERPEHERGEQKINLDRLSDSIVFENVVFQYPNAKTRSLDGVDLTIRRGETVAFVGPNGCGKTTLLSLVPRLFDPTSGRVLFDGHDLREARLKSLRSQISVVTQETVLFRDTIANNIAYGLGNVPRETIEEAAKMACADEFIRRKPDGYDHVVGERGLTLSGGERQRIALARAILRDPAILILDEATSMIDADTEAQITEMLDQYCKNRTTLVIAHRLSTVVGADQIVVMDQGKVVDKGTHSQLLGRCELYQLLCRTQLLGQDAESRNGADSADADSGVIVDQSLAIES